MTLTIHRDAGRILARGDDAPGLNGSDKSDG